MRRQCDGIPLKDMFTPVHARLKFAVDRFRRQFTSHARARVTYQHHIYLPQWKLIYYFVPKVACTSIKTVLGKLLSLPAKRSPHDYPFPKLERSRFDRGLADYRSFAVVREPVSRLLSGYKSMVMRPVHDRHYFHGVFRPLVKYGGFRHAMPFEDFCRRVVEIPDRWSDPHFRSQSACFTDPQRGCLAHHMIRFESLNAELPAYLQQVTGRRVDLPKQNNTGSLPAIPVLSQECVQLLRRRFDDDFRRYEGLGKPLHRCA